MNIRFFEKFPGQFPSANGTSDMKLIVLAEQPPLVSEKEVFATPYMDSYRVLAMPEGVDLTKVRTVRVVSKQMLKKFKGLETGVTYVDYSELTPPHHERQERRPAMRR